VCLIDLTCAFQAINGERWLKLHGTVQLAFATLCTIEHYLYLCSRRLRPTSGLPECNTTNPGEYDDGNQAELSQATTDPPRHVSYVSAAVIVTSPIVATGGKRADDVNQSSRARDRKESRVYKATHLLDQLLTGYDKRLRPGFQGY